MTTDDDLRRLLHDAVDDVEPADRLGEIRRRTAAGRRRPTRRVLSLAGAVAATAGVIGAVALVGQWREDAPGPATEPTAYPAAIYFVSETPIGPRLYREFQTVENTSEAAERVLTALRRMETGAGPDDPDYTTLWPSGSFVDVEVGAAQITIELGDVAVDTPAGPTGVRDLSVQQAVHTADAAIGSPLPVTFTQNDSPATTVLGVPVPATVARLTRFEAPVNISDPAEGTQTDRTFTARGQVTPAFSEPDQVAWELLRGDETVLAGTTPVADLSWEIEINVPGPTGQYTLRTWSIDSLHAEAVDTRTFVVR